ncbi:MULTISPECIES: methyl-accepting chemotaxis protein [Paraburkholderia]|uniref:methyl-accepting chemotaxis protein n=1 Tax=Paraburkholderia TaxID=1822464 RepID=UPI002AB660D3|nr:MULTISPECIES: methyl-accepting chemotaxis protein [Paraburkholderia]
MKVSTKLIALVLLTLIGVAAVVGIALYSLRASLIETRRSEIVILLSKAEHIVNFYRSQEDLGRLTRDQAQMAAKVALSQLNSDEKSYFWATTLDGIALVHVNSRYVGTRTTDFNYRPYLAVSHFALVDVVTRRPADGTLLRKLQGVVEIPDWHWLVGTGFFYDDIDAAFWTLATRLLVVSLAVVAVVAALAWWMTRGIGRALGGEPAAAARVASEISGGNLAVEVSVARHDRSSLLFALADMRDNLRTLVSNIRQSSQSIATGANEIAQGNTDLSRRTETQAASLQQTAASMEELTSAVRQNAEHAQQANALVETAASESRLGGDAVREVVETMRSIADQAGKMEGIIGVIESIAFQTNILALNAAVEAARAGESGRGFAVVAGEVRSLAQRCAVAARDIKDLIGRSVTHVRDGTGLVKAAGERMDSIVHSIHQVNDIIQEISSAAVQQSAGIEEVNRAVAQMDEVTQQNAALVEQAAAAASSLDEQAVRLLDAVSVFRGDCRAI